jgi:hypothetical protein
MQLLQGISVDVSLHLWKRIADLTLKVIENAEVDASTLPILAALSPAFLLRIRGNLDLEIDEEMKQKLQENPLLEIAMIDASTLVGSTSSVGSDDEFDEFVQNALPPPFSPYVQLLAKHLGDDLQISIVDSLAGVKARVQGEGVVQLLRTAVKYFPSE